MPIDTPPAQIGRFLIQRELGRGMMGVVYEAHDPALHRTIALKVIRLTFAASDEECQTFEQRFMTEARAAAGLSHPGIVVVHEVGRDPETGLLYLALEHLPGQTLSERIAKGGPLEEREALRLALRVAQALHYAHGRGVVHRDVKPANVMVLPDGEPKILDFGLAKLEAGHEHTAAGQFLGTPLFMSPEQALGQPADARSDLFSLGAILYTLLTGRRPFEADNVARILARVAHQPPPPLREAAPSVSPDTEYVVLRALRKDPEERYATGAAMAEDIADVLAGRPPRHRAEPLPAAPLGEETMVSRPEDEARLPELALEPPASRPRRHLPLRAMSLTLLLGGLALYYLSVSGPERLAEVVAFLLTPPLTTRPAVPRRTGESPADPTATASPSPLPEPTETAAASAEPVATATADLDASSSAAPAPSPSPSLIPSGSLEARASSPAATDETAKDDAGSPDTAPPPGAAESAAGEIAPIVLPDTDEVGSEDSSQAPPSPKALTSDHALGAPFAPGVGRAGHSPRAPARKGHRARVARRQARVPRRALDGGHEEDPLLHLQGRSRARDPPGERGGALAAGGGPRGGPSRLGPGHGGVQACREAALVRSPREHPGKAHLPVALA
jgi:eukaryotic-like serine/threonine-protein kinase